MQGSHVWKFQFEDGRNGSEPNMPEASGDAIREIISRLHGPGWLPIPGPENTFSRGEFDCTHCDGRKLWVFIYRTN